MYESNFDYRPATILQKTVFDLKYLAIMIDVVVFNVFSCVLFFKFTVT